MAFKTNNSIISRETGLISTKSALDLTSTASNETTLISGSSAYALSIAVGQNKFVVGALKSTSPYYEIRVYDFDGTLLHSLAPTSSLDNNYYKFTQWWGRSSVGIADNIIIFGSFGNGADGGAIYAHDLQLNKKWKVNESSKKKFGERVYIGEGRILVSSEENGAENVVWPSPYFNQGYLYIYDYNGNFIRRITFSHNNPEEANQKFGTAVSIGNGRILVGCANERAHPDNGDSINQLNVGFCYLYDLDGNLIKRFNHYGIIDGLSPSDYYGNGFGQSVSISDGKIVVGAPHMDRGNKTQAGRVFTFDINGENGAELLPSAPSQIKTDNRFGSCVKIGCGRIFVSAPRFNTNGDAWNSGKIFEFDLDGNELGQIVLSDYAQNDYLGAVNTRGSQSMAVGHGKFVIFRDSQNRKTFHFDVPPIEDYFSKFTK